MSYVTVELSLTAAYFLCRSKWTRPAERARIEKALRANGDEHEYIEVDLDAVAVNFLAADLNHEFVHGRHNRQTADLLEEVCYTLDSALRR